MTACFPSVLLLFALEAAVLFKKRFSFSMPLSRQSSFPYPCPRPRGGPCFPAIDDGRWRGAKGGGRSASRTGEAGAACDATLFVLFLVDRYGSSNMSFKKQARRPHERESVYT